MRKKYLFRGSSYFETHPHNNFCQQTSKFPFRSWYHFCILLRRLIHLTIAQLQIHFAYHLSTLQRIWPHSNVYRFLAHRPYHWPIRLHRHLHQHDTEFPDHSLGCLSIDLHTLTHQSKSEYQSLIFWLRTILLRMICRCQVRLFKVW